MSKNYSFIFHFLIFYQFLPSSKKIGLSFCMTTERTNHHYWTLLSFDKPSPVINVRDSCSRASFRLRKPDEQLFSSSFFFLRYEVHEKIEQPLIDHEYSKYDSFNYDSFKNNVIFITDIRCAYLLDSLDNLSLK